ncbi:MAG: hypothetical protein JNM72_21825 [Deltaproteobacteria bacterium]|nr:hypothetical protein [Deltaproteobacteria bacterium]
MTRSAHLLLCLGLLAPLAAWAAGQPGAPVVAAPVDATPLLRASNAKLAALGPAERAQMAVALRDLTARCPYTRAAMLLPFVLHEGLAAISEADVAPAAQVELAALRSALAGQAEALATLGVEVPAPRAPRPEEPTAPRGAAPDPIRVMATTIAEITPIARGIDDAAQAQIDALSAQVEATTGVARPCPRGPWAVRPGHPWTLGMEHGEARGSLARLSAAAVNTEARAQLDALVGLIDALAEVNHQSRALRAP